MTAEQAMQEINAILDSYFEADISQLRALARISQVMGSYLAGRK